MIIGCCNVRNNIPWKFVSLYRMWSAWRNTDWYELYEIIVCIWMIFRFLVKEKEWDLMNKLFQAGSILKPKYYKSINPNDISTVVKNAYIHPCCELCDNIE